MQLVLYTSLQLQILCTILPTLLIYSPSNWRCIWDPVKHMKWNFFCRNGECVKAVGYFGRRPPWCIFNRMFNRILNATLPNILLWLEEGLRRSFRRLELCKATLDFPAPNSLIYITNKEISSTT